ncbi:helix-turn-helix transcriptional regulator [Microvirga yunnanensis]|uniref:helix-turn-helix transcriptional regulator n=1 Tax=Microvirga yunnanensis TaxID=2953740 RepID=UPI0021C962A3|nr:LuxR family transcriptional regulator [Microvirga sp. HBU65207]
MEPDRELSDLIGRIYDCALDGSLWPDVLARITEALDGVMADLSVVDPLAGNGRVTAFHNWPQDVLELAMAHFSITPARGAILTFPLLEPMCTSRHLDIVAFHNSRYWKTCFAGRGYYDYLVTGLSRNVSRLSGWGVVGAESRGAFGDRDIELARLLSPHIQRALNISGALDDRRVEAGTLRGALDALAAAAVIVEPGGRIRFTNAVAQAELARGNLFRETKGRLIGTTAEASRLLAGLRGVDGHQRGRDALLADPAGRTVHVTWAILEQVGEELGSPILILLRQPEPDLATPVSVATSAFRLTRAETQVLAHVLEGHTLAEVAGILGVARSTVKSHLEAIYAKTGTRRVPELVRRAVGLVPPLRE